MTATQSPSFGSSTRRAPDQMSWHDRAGALTGAAYVLMILVGNQIATGGAQDVHPTGAKDLVTLADQATSTAARTGQAIEMIGMVSFAFFLAWFVHLMRRAGGAAAWLSTAALVGGVTTLSVKIASVLPVIAATIDRRQISATTARVLVDQNNAGFVTTFLTFGIFMVGAGLAVLGSGVLGRVAGWLAVVIGALGIVESAVAVSLDVNPVPFLLGLLWILAISIRLAWKGPRGQVNESRILSPAA